MRRIGKYEKLTPQMQKKVEAYNQRKKKYGVLKTYLYSLLCLLLCCGMFLGTTFAWFTSETVSKGNEINIGILKAQLSHNGAVVDENHKVFPSEMKWLPGNTKIEVLEIENKGDLEFKYILQFVDRTELADGVTLESIAKWFEVYYYTGEMTGEITDDLTDEDWHIVTDSVGDAVTLYEILTQRLPVYSGELKAGAAKKFAIALHLNENATTDIGGQKLCFDVKLTAHQKAQEYVGYNVVEIPDNTDLSTCKFESNTVYKLVGDSYTVSKNESLLIDVHNVVLQGMGAEKTVIDTGIYANSAQGALYISGNNVTVRDLTITTTAGSNDQRVSAIKVSATSYDGGDVVKNVTIQNVIVKSTTGNGVNLHGVKGVKLNGVDVQSYGGCAFSLAEATDVVFTNCKTAAGLGWKADVGCMYGTGEFYDTPSSFRFDASNEFGNNAMYSERPATAGTDTVVAPTGWVQQTDATTGKWILTNATVQP